MNPQKKTMLWINVLGGVTVLGSYAWGLATHPGQGNALWGNIPQGLRTLYTVNMFLAALGYFAFTSFLLFVLDFDHARINIKAGFKGFNLIYAAILFPSALWMPLTFLLIEHPGNQIWLADRLVLTIVGLASLGMLSALLSVQPRKPVLAFWLAITGCIFFCIQTAILDALVWTNYFFIQ